MKTIRALCSALLIVSLTLFVPSVSPASSAGGGSHPGSRGSTGAAGRAGVPPSLRPATGAFDYHSATDADAEAPTTTRAGGGIREEISDRYRARYKEWKDGFLSTELGRRQWARYAQNPRLVLTITMSADNRHGADTGKYRWNDSGELVGATITLGSEIDKEFPDPVYYPVMNSLGWSSGLYEADGNILAATKIAHEFGHVLRAENSDAKLYRLQNKLMPIYRTIFLNNGHNVNDPRLVDLARQMGGTSVEVWEDREYWGEANAMRYLRDRVSEKGFRCHLFSRIKRTVDEYAENYADRFDQIAHSKPTLCGWQ